MPAKPRKSKVANVGPHQSKEAGPCNYPDFPKLTPKEGLECSVLEPNQILVIDVCRDLLSLIISANRCVTGSAVSRGMQGVRSFY